MMRFKFGLCSFIFSLMLGMASAWADVDISGKTQIKVDSWLALKNAVETAAADTVIVLTQDIQADADNPIDTVANTGIIIDGGGFTITGTKGTEDGQFINFGSTDKTNLIIQNVNLKGFGNVNTRDDYEDYSGVIYIYNGTIGNITADFTNNYVHSDSDPAFGGAIANIGIISNITGDFTGNYTSTDSSYARGGAIYNKYKIGNITGDFSGNYAQASSSANGGAIYNDMTATIGNISGNFTDNHIQSTSGSALGGAIYNTHYASIGNITGNFERNYAQSTSDYAQGGAIYNLGTGAKIGTITGNFEGNYAKSDSDYAQGGAIYNYGTMTLSNSSFINNYVQTGAAKDSEAGQQTQGGAIYSTKNLTIKADAGNSIFSGNKIKWGDGQEESSAIYLEADDNVSNLFLDSQNGGKIQFDDKISSNSPIEDLIRDVIAAGATVTDDGNGGYIVEYEGQQIHLENDNDFFKNPSTPVDQSSIPNDEVEMMIPILRQNGLKITQDGENYYFIDTLNVLGGGLAKYELIKQDDGTYLMSSYQGYSSYGGNMVITGDNSSQVVFNNAIENVGTINITKTNVNVNKGAGTIYRTVTHDGGVLNINSGAKAEDSVVNDKGTLHVAAGGTAENTTVNLGGSLIADNEAKVNNMLANEGAKLDIDAGSLLTGDIVIHAGATMGGNYDYSQIFKDEVSDAGSLTLVGGLNGALNESSLINSTEGKKLHLTDGSYVIGDGAQAVNGWDLLTLQNNANVKLEGDIALSDAIKKIIIKNGSELNLAGNSPSNYTITGSVSNDGSLNFTHPDDDADDITTIYGNYTAYNNAQMTIDVNPTANTSDLLRIDGDVAGTTTVNLNFVNGEAETTKMIPFVEALNDDLSTGAYFIINRMYSNAYTWNSLYKDGVWYVGTSNVIPDNSENGYGNGNMGNIEDDTELENDAQLPDGFPTAPTTPGGSGNSGKSPSVVGEAIAYMGLPSAGIEQTRDMTRNITNKVASTKVYSKQCHGFYDCEYDGSPLRNAWAAPVYSYSDVKAPYSYEAEITGFEGGFDIQSDIYNRLGVFASYRQGSYDFDGDGDDYYSKVGSEMDIDSYILGLYHRYDEGKLWTMGQLFLGYQDVSLSSDDGVSSSTDGIEFGAAIEGGLIFNPMTNLTIEPIIRLAYTQINYDDASDNYGKTAHYGDVSNLEVEAGVKVEKTYLRKNGYAKLYVKPSIIQNIGSGDVQVTSLQQVDGLENSTLGRLEVGGSMSFDEQWSGYANTFYTFGSDYTNLGLNAGLNYAF